MGVSFEAVKVVNYLSKLKREIHFMNQEFTQNIFDVLPAFLAMVMTGSLLVYFFRDHERSKPEVVLFSFLFIISGFIVQIVNKNISAINLSIEKYKGIFSFPIISAITGTFVVNKLLKHLSDEKEKRELVILLVETINSQIRSLSWINFYTSNHFSSPEKYMPEMDFLKIKENKNLVDIYTKNLIQNKYLESAFSKIGIFSENEIQTICYFVTSLGETLCYLEKINILDSSDFSNHLLTWILKSHLLHTILMGSLVVYQLDYRYTRKDYLIITTQFVNDYKRNIYPLLNLFECPSIYYKINGDGKLMIDVIDRLRYIRSEFKRINTFEIKEETISICRINAKSISMEKIDYLVNKIFQYNPSFILPDEFIHFEKNTVITDIESNAKNKLIEFMCEKINHYNNQVSQDDKIDLNCYINQIQNIPSDDMNIEVITPWG